MGGLAGGQAAGEPQGVGQDGGQVAEEPPGVDRDGGHSLIPFPLPTCAYSNQKAIALQQNLDTVVWPDEWRSFPENIFMAK